MATRQILEYNGYVFNEYTEISVSASMVQDDAQTTVLYNRYRIRAETTIYADAGDSPGQAGTHFARIRDRLSKQGKYLVISHLGFNGTPFDVNFTGSGRRDVTLGPHPRMISWDAIGHDNAVHVVWECEVCVSECERYTGVMSVNHRFSARIDPSGYTTITHSGYLEVAATVDGDNILAAADNFRQFVFSLPALEDYQRETSWNTSPDNRRLEFTIVESQIRSPNAFATGVVNITGNHGVAWQRNSAAKLTQTIRATIELRHGVARSYAWEVFKAIVTSRVAFTTASGVTLFFDQLYIDESLFANTFSFSINYRTIMAKPDDSILTALAGAFSASGFAAPINLGTWANWKSNMLQVTGNRGISDIRLRPNGAQIHNLCSDNFVSPTKQVTPTARPPMPTAGTKLYNDKPPARESYLKYDSWIELDEEVPTTTQVTVDPDDLELKTFNPSDENATLEPAGSTTGGGTAVNVTRYVESQAGRVEIVWRGYAERIGYPIPRPDKLKVGDVTLYRVGRAQFRQKFIGNVLGQPVYAAAWNQRYAVSMRPKKMNDNDMNIWQGL